jgi:hypothetical protein
LSSVQCVGRPACCPRPRPQKPHPYIGEIDVSEPTKTYIVLSEKSACLLLLAVVVFVGAFGIFEGCDLKWAFDRGYSLGIVTEANEQSQVRLGATARN